MQVNFFGTVEAAEIWGLKVPLLHEQRHDLYSKADQFYWIVEGGKSANQTPGDVVVEHSPLISSFCLHWVT